MCTVGAGRSSDRYGGGATTGSTPAAGRSTEMEELVAHCQQIDRDGGARFAGVSGIGGEWGRQGRERQGQQRSWNIIPSFIFIIYSSSNDFNREWF